MVVLPKSCASCTVRLYWQSCPSQIIDILYQRLATWMAYEALSHSAYTVYCRIARHLSFLHMMVQNSIVMTRWPFWTKTLGVFLRIYTSTPWGGVSFWIVYWMVLTWHIAPQSWTEYLAFLSKAIFRLSAPIGKSLMAEVNGRMYVLLDSIIFLSIIILPEAIIVKFSHWSSSPKTGMSRMSIIYCYPLTTLLRRFSKSLLLSQPSVHQQISGIKHTYWLCNRRTGCQRPTQILWPTTWRPAKKRQWRDWIYFFKGTHPCHHENCR